MRIKRTFGSTMREALQQVKTEQGPEAIILGNNKVPGGVEILSAVDTEEELVNPTQLSAAAHQAPPTASSTARSPAPAVAATLAPKVAETAPPPRKNPLGAYAIKEEQDWNQLMRREPVIGDLEDTEKEMDNLHDLMLSSQADAKNMAQQAQQMEGLRAEETLSKPSNQSRNTSEQAYANSNTAPQAMGQANPEPSVQPLIHEMKDELKTLRDMMENQLNILEWDRFSRRHPVRVVLLNLLTEMGLGSDISDRILKSLGDTAKDPHKVWQLALALLAKSLPLAEDDLLARGGVVALVGSTGVGKTTTIAKLAARFAHTHGKRQVALISTDTFRIGAQEQLQHFARMLEIPLLTAASADELSDRLAMLGDKKLVLVDTAGMGQRDVSLAEQFHSLQAGAPQIQPYLVMSANTQLAALSETIRNFSRVQLAGTIVTKVDESVSLGGVMTAAIRHQLPLAYLGTGQRVPEDLQPVRSHRLVSKAVAMMKQYSEQPEQESMAMRFGRMISGADYEQHL